MIRQKRTRSLPLSKLFPNILTLMGLCVALSSIRFALEEKWQLAAAAIILAALIDGMDGRLARLLNATSDFGAQLDSLADIVNFGVCPAILLYVWSLDAIGRWGWVAVLFFAVCCAIRLARFGTTLLDETRPDWADKFFSGIPSPAGAILAITPLMLSFELKEPMLHDPWFIGVYVVVIGCLMASPIPTFSGKKMSISYNFVPMLMISVTLFTAMMIIEPWFTLACLAVLYVLTIPLSILSFLRHEHQLKSKN